MTAQIRTHPDDPLLHLGSQGAHYLDRAGWLREAVLGANDGIVSVSSLIVGVAAADPSPTAVLVAGAAGLAAAAVPLAAALLAPEAQIIPAVVITTLAGLATLGTIGAAAGGAPKLPATALSVGLDQVFAEIAELAPECGFRDCTHDHEPGCAVQAAVADGRLDPERLERWRRLRDENRSNTPVQSGPRGTKQTKPVGKRNLPPKETSAHSRRPSRG